MSAKRCSDKQGLGCSDKCVLDSNTLHSADCRSHGLQLQRQRDDAATMRAPMRLERDESASSSNGGNATKARNP